MLRRTLAIAQQAVTIDLTRGRCGVQYQTATAQMNGMTFDHLAIKGRWHPATGCPRNTPFRSPLVASAHGGIGVGSRRPKHRSTSTRSLDQRRGLRQLAQAHIRSVRASRAFATCRCVSRARRAALVLRPNRCRTAVIPADKRIQSLNRPHTADVING